MKYKLCYGKIKLTVGTILEEVNDINDSLDHELYVVVLDPEPGDSQRQDTDEEDIHDNPDDMLNQWVN